jgi:hypothetical protein
MYNITYVYIMNVIKCYILLYILILGNLYSNHYKAVPKNIQKL